MRMRLDRRVAALEAASKARPFIDFSGLTKSQRDRLRVILEDRWAGRITLAEAEARGRLLFADEGDGAGEMHPDR